MYIWNELVMHSKYALSLCHSTVYHVNEAVLRLIYVMPSIPTTLGIANTITGIARTRTATDSAGICGLGMSSSAWI